MTTNGENSHSASTEDYLKHTLKLLLAAEREGGKNARIKTGELAESLNVTPASATGMVRRLSEQGLMAHKPYGGVTLTARGRKAAMALLRKHRLAELLLTQTLGYRWDEVHAEAERLEHVISDELADRISARLGNPTHDPYGNPIPTKNGKIVTRKLLAARQLCVGDSGVIRRVADADTVFLRYCESLRLLPGATITIVGRAPYGGVTALTVECGRKISVGDSVTEKIHVEKVP